MHKVRAQALRNTTCSSPFLSFCNTHGETMSWPITGAGMKDRCRKPSPTGSWKLNDSHLICSPTTKIKLITVVFCCWDFESVHYKHSAAGVWLIYSVELRIMWIFLVLDILNLTVASAPSAALSICLTFYSLRTVIHRNTVSLWRNIVPYFSGLRICC